ncbi:PQQ-binding-like beta-propeller repeat protein [Thermogemmatispora carboxidivorans]|uniref:outer membrane protein assembly factor BamB family protein n=1 Tax=Thermogemmatispora carboxidivorans TaxID=1382306 RepID=UPI00138E1219|nr:PQQ-binding-like beta-propeller repeat protein [Thermogemmatispora carboxidivorans]
MPAASRAPFPWLRWWEEARARRWLLGSALGLLLLTLLLAVILPLLREAFLFGASAPPSTATSEPAALLTSSQNLLLTVNGDRLYAFSSKGVLSAVEAHDGRLLWRYTLPVAASQFLPSSPFVANGVVYISGACFAASPPGTPHASLPCLSGSGARTIVAAVRASDGHLLWQRAEEGRLFANTLIDGKLYLVQSLTSAALIEAVEAKTGQVLWQRHLSGSLSGVLVGGDQGDQMVVALPLGAQKQPDTQLFALRLDDGQPLWSQMLPGSLRPVLEEQGRIYLATDAQGASAPLPETLLCQLDSRSGAQLWQHTIPGQLVKLNLFGSRTGNKLLALTDVAKTAPSNTYGGDVTLFLALDDKNGQLLWQRPVNEGLSLAILAQEHNGMFYLALERQDQPQAQLMAVSVSNGQPLWQQRYPGQGLMSAQPNGTMLYAAVNDNAVLALDGTTGQFRWRTRFADTISDLALAPSNPLQLYVSTSSGQLAALDSSSGHLHWLRSLAE